MILTLSRAAAATSVVAANQVAPGRRVSKEPLTEQPDWTPGFSHCRVRGVNAPRWGDAFDLEAGFQLGLQI
jgi:hypothetical protein